MSITLTWASVSGATSYEVQIATDGGFVSIIDDNSTSGLVFISSDLSSGTLYYWRVRGVNSGGNGMWSSTWSFTVNLSAPALSSPPNAGTLSGLGTKLVWTSVTGATSYVLQVASDSSFTSIIYNATTAEVFDYVSGLTESDTYYWRVAAVASVGVSDWATYHSFTAAASVVTPDMAYELEKIAKQLQATIQANTLVTTNKVYVDFHVGEITRQTFETPEMMEGLIHRAPFIFIQYQGKRGNPERDATGSYYIHEIVWRFFAGAPTAERATSTQVLNAFPMLRSIYSAIHGKVPLMDPAVQSQKLPGSPTLTASTDLPDGIDTVGFNPTSPFLEIGGQDERLVANVRGIIVYQTDYSIKVAASA